MTKPQPGATAFLKICRSETITGSQIKENSNHSRRVIIDNAGRRYGRIETLPQSYTVKSAEV